MVAGRMLLSSNVIQICVRVVMLGAYDPHPSPRYAPSKVLCRNAQQLADGLLVEARGLTPPQAKLITLALLQDQWMPHKLINGILIEGDPLASHLGALVPDSLLCRPCVGIELHDYLWVVLSHG